MSPKESYKILAVVLIGLVVGILFGGYRQETTGSGDSMINAVIFALVFASPYIAWVMIQRNKLKKRCTTKVAGTITGFKRVSRNVFLKVTYAAPDGTNHVINLVYADTQVHGLADGSVITIFINPLKPEEHYSPDYPTRYIA